MSATASWPGEHRRLIFAGWIGFAAASQAAMLLLPDLETVAFHLVWISLAIVYGVQGWSTRRAVAVLLPVIILTGAAMWSFIATGHAEWPELAEVPLMAGVFLTMVWHVRRRTAALAQTQALADRERRAHEMMELFVRNCSHEMRTPITVARGYAELVREVLPTGAGRDDLDVVVDELDKLSGLAGRLLSLAAAYEPASFELAPVELAALVRRTAQRWRPSARRTWTVQASPVTVEADESRLEAALDALVENAVAFTTVADTITLSCEPIRGGAMVQVEDSGIGFAASRRATAAAGSGVDPGVAGTRRGTGLGLAIVRAIAEGHGGRLCQIEDRQQGALVRIELPTRAPATPAR